MVATLNLDPWQKVRQPLFRHFRPFLEENIFWPKTLLPPPSPHSTYQRRGSWCQKTNHGANHGANMVPTMVPTMVPWCQPIFSPYQIISGRKYFLIKKFPPSPLPCPFDIKTGVTGVMGVRGGDGHSVRKVIRASFSPFQIISRGKRNLSENFWPPLPPHEEGGGSYSQKSDLTNFLAISDYFQRKFYFGWDEFAT